MQREYHFVNINAKTLEVYQRVLAQNIQGSSFHLRTLYEHAPQCDTYVSAANSSLFFDGGSDTEYIRLFGNPKEIMMTHLRQFWRENPGVLCKNNTREHLPVGAAMAKQIPLVGGDGSTKTFITAPTMILPQRVPHTRNAYYAFKMVLELLDKRNLWQARVMIPGLCTGVGAMSDEDSAQQILQAYQDYAAGVRLDQLPSSCKDFVFNSAVMQTQPRYYMNTLFMDFEVTPDELLGFK